MKRLNYRFVVALAVGTLIPVVASAQQMVQRPFHMVAHSQLAIALSPDCTPASPYFPLGCAYEARAEGVATHMGEVVAHEAGILLPQTQGVMIAANGDQLTYLFSAVSGLVMITGGTGRFEGATGEITLLITPEGGATIDGATLTQNFTWTGSGTITY